MAIKYFCDECKKTLKYDQEYYKVECRGERWESLIYCSNCFKKHWNGNLPESPKSKNLC